ncbi:hypothetical protein N5W20_01190 [Candidatus Kirkpatrickella diaphorinae]|uniref:Uncharacterized protein n=1 Tax=Candidatus Kirkpatrickella diaphorinae TaxID=2984322 RepID=A0ABY6GJB6_9PROT|nr:hypothetical protein [Candidatus Kirkpatrickella diaphorinae]UYH51525.1 hypothetical protein N5W20_01190 [Candidatus Kirkpatrickella diaphorinae]
MQESDMRLADQAVVAADASFYGMALASGREIGYATSRWTRSSAG